MLYIDNIKFIMKTKIILALFLLTAIELTDSFSSFAAPGKLMVGTAKVNITPKDNGVVIHDSLYARSIVIDVNGQRLAVISFDLGGYTNNNLLKICREKYGISQLLLCPSHTHSGGQSRDRSILENQMVRVIDLAVKGMFPARISSGERSFPQLGFNRLIVRDDGHAREPWFEDGHYTYINSERIPFGPVDPAVGIIKIEDMDGHPRAIIMNYACHSDAVWGNFAISADYPGVACRFIEKKYPKANCLFIEGAAGNIAPLFKTPGRNGPDDPFQTDYSLIERMGMLLAVEAVKLTESLTPKKGDDAELKFMTDSMKFTGRFDKTVSFNIYVTTIMINKDIVIATFPGEPFIKFQLDWKEEVKKTENASPFFFGYTWTGGRWPGYVADIRSAALGGYGADQDSRIIEVGAGERVMNRQLENYYKLNGLMRDKPGPAEFEHGTRYQVTPVAPLGKPQPQPLDKK
jgi:neutral ceramidase